MKEMCDANRRNNSVNFKKGKNRGIEYLLNCYPMFLGVFNEIEGVLRYTK